MGSQLSNILLLRLFLESILVNVSPISITSPRPIALSDTRPHFLISSRIWPELGSDLFRRIRTQISTVPDVMITQHIPPPTRNLPAAICEPEFQLERLVPGAISELLSLATEAVEEQYHPGTPRHHRYYLHQVPLLQAPADSFHGCSSHADAPVL